ncbi:MAG: hypothetical protein ABI688_03420 [Bacteroidota bacterium]
MKRTIALSLLLLALLSNKVNAQVEVAKLLGKNSKDFNLGYGGALKFGFPVSDAADVCVEAGIMIFLEKEYPEYGALWVPFKLSYRYTLNGTGSGLYAEPQVGYNIYGVESYYNYDTYEDVDRKFHGLTWSAGIGYLFRSSRKMRTDLGLRYESLMYKGGTKNFIALRLSRSFNFRKTDD